MQIAVNPEILAAFSMIRDVYCFAALCLAGSASARRISPTVSGIGENIETRCSFVHPTASFVVACARNFESLIPFPLAFRPKPPLLRVA